METGSRKTISFPRFLLEHRWVPNHRRTVGHRNKSEKPPETDGLSGFSTRNQAANRFQATRR